MRNRSHVGVDRYVSLPRPPGRDGAMDRLVAHGFPGRRDEEWYYTPTKRLLEEAFTPVVGAPREPSAALADALPEGDRLVFIDGLFHHGLSTFEGVLQATDAVGDLLSEPLGFDALNAAMWRTGAQVGVDSSREQPIHLVHISTGEGRFAALRHRITVAAGVSACVVEHYLGQGGAALVAAVSEVSLGEGARLDHVVLQDADLESHHLHTLRVQVGSKATYVATSVQSGAKLSRTAMHVELAGVESQTHLAGLALGNGGQHIDHHVLVDHAVPQCTSRQNFRSVLDDKARSVFTGKVVVRKDAQQTDSAQDNHNLLLSDDAVANTRPQLEIYADDVACAHGATVGSIDGDSLFYLQQRGLSPMQARGLLMEGFVRAVLDEVANPEVSVAAHGLVSSWLASR